VSEKIELAPGQSLHPVFWHCGDEVCDCWCPQIELRGRNDRWPHALISIVWEGTFHSEPTSEEYAEQRAELREACKRYGIECPKEYLE